MMMNMMGHAQNKYRQGHYIGRINDSRAYASIPLGFKWSPGPVMEYTKAQQEDTAIVMGPNHALAYKQHIAAENIEDINFTTQAQIPPQRMSRLLAMLLLYPTTIMEFM